jgi:hypothetical protein
MKKHWSGSESLLVPYALGSVADPDPPEPHVFGPPGSGSFYHHAKIVRKTLIPTILWLLCTVPSKSNKPVLRVSDPYPDLHGSALIWVAGSGTGSAFKLRIRIRIQKGKNNPKKWKKFPNFHVFKYWMFSFEQLEKMLDPYPDPH